MVMVFLIFLLSLVLNSGAFLLRPGDVIVSKDWGVSLFRIIDSFALALVRYFPAPI